ncbi:MAG: SDR family NAD(P)-dependent oxidoreductase [Eubacteriales bacterium]|nr:SDR family NAD(P)-dependent oxidoreductase [Eubacteriales bacterium]
MKLNQLNLQDANHNININKIRSTDIAIIGISVKMPGANTIHEFWNNLLDGVDHVKPILSSRLNDIQAALSSGNISIDTKQLKNCALLNRIDCFDYNFFHISPKEAELMDPHQRIFLQTAWEAFEDAGYGGDILNGSATGIFAAVNSGYTTAYKTLSMRSENMDEGFFVTGNIESLLASRISFFKNLKGPTMIIDSACSSSLVCLHEACRAIQTNDCDLALVGGVSICLLPIENQKIGISSPDGKTRSFDALANGAGLGEGSIAIILKSYQKALKDRDAIYAVIKGSAVNQDGHSLSLTAPNPASQADVIEKAWNCAGINPSDVSYIEAHGTATKIGDPIEIQGITQAFSKFTNHKQFCSIGSIKSNVGHLGNLAGLAGFVKMILAIKNKTLPPTINFTYPNMEIDFHKSPVYIQDSSSKWENKGTERICGVSSFGISGTNCHVVLAEDTQKSITSPDDKVDLFTLSAVSSFSLHTLVSNYLDFIDKEDFSFNDLCYTINCGRGHYKYRIAFIATGTLDLKEKLHFIYNKLLESKSIDSINSIISQWGIEVTERTTSLLTLQQQYILGEEINWKKCYEETQSRRIHAPVYPFELLRCWAKINYNNTQDLFQVRWVNSSMPNYLEMTDEFRRKKSALLIIRPSLLAQSLLNLFKLKYEHLVIAELSNTYDQIANDYYYITGNRDEIIQIINQQFDKGLNHIIFVIPEIEHEINNLNELKKYVNVDFSLLFHVSSILEEKKKDKVTVYLFLNNVFSINNNDNINRPEHTMLFSLAKSMNLENLYTKFRCIDIDSSISAKQILAEIESEGHDVWIVYRDQQRYVEMLDFIELPSEQQVKVRENGVYIVTGGLGQIGRYISLFLASAAQTTVVILSRSNHDDILAASTNITLKNEEYIFEKTKSRIVCLQTDVSEEEALSSALNDIRNRFGSIHGIVHCAGIVSNGSPVKGRNEIQEEFFKAKVYGTWLLNKLTIKDNLDFFILFSSFITLIGGAFSCEYAAANTFEVALADYRTKLNLPITVIDWTIWEETVKNNGFDYDHFLYKPISTERALALWEKIFYSGVKRVIAGELNEEQGYLDIYTHLPFKLSDNILTTFNDKKQMNIRKSKEIEISLTSALDVDFNDIEKKIGNVVGNLLGLTTIDIDEDLFGLGMNSILAVKFEVDAQKNELNLKYEDVYVNNSIRKLANILQENNDYDESARMIKKSNELDNADGSRILKETITPFNDFFYRECYFLSLFSISKHLNMDILTFLTNDVPVYYKDNDSGYINVQYINCIDLEELFLDNYIQPYYEPYQEDLASQIKLKIDMGNPVIVWLDSFYQPYIMDTFQKQHIQHTCTIYGYDSYSSEQIFHVVDHISKDSLSYSQQTISFIDLQKACVKYQENFPASDANKLLVTFEKTKNGIQHNKVMSNENSENYFKFYIKNKDLVLHGMEVLHEFINEIKAVIEDRSVYLSYYQNMMEIINVIVNTKKAETYKMKHLYGEESFYYKISMEIENAWDMLRKILTKMYYTTQQYQENQSKLQNYLQAIGTGENELIEHILLRRKH